MISDRPPHLLLIDDDEGFCRLVRKHLERAGFNVVCAYSAESGQDLAGRGGIDAVILDHVLPGQDGLVLLAEISSRPDALPVIYLTGSQDGRVAIAALKAGAADYVVKDLNGEFLDLLENAITTALRAAEIRRARDTAEAEVRESRDRFEALAAERALLLGEVNHRVSNSLQLIASLLHFQGEISSSADVKSALKEANGRVLAVARVHRSLYTSGDVHWVSLADYLTTLVQDLTNVSSNADGDEITVEATSVFATPDITVSVGIVVTELVLNALKHAYPDKKGPVRVKLSHTQSQIFITVEDDGVGTHDESGADKHAKSRGLGQRIMRGMAEKLDGEIIYEKGYTGTRAVLSFPIGAGISVSGLEMPQHEAA